MSEKKARFTLIDFLIILVVIAGIAVVAIKILPGKVNMENETVRYTVLLNQKEDGFVDAMNIGDVVSISNKEKDTGVIVGLEKKVSETMTYDSINGAYKNEIIEDKQDVYVTLESPATVTDGLITADSSTPVKVGIQLPVRGKGYASMGFVIGVELKEGE